MKCKLCENYYLEEETFENIFNFESICKVCKKVYSPKLNEEVIPIDLGEMSYYYLYQDIKMSLKQIAILNKHLEIIYRMLLSKKNTYDLILFLDDNIFNYLLELKLLSADYKNIFLFSLIRKDFLYQDIFL